MVARSRRLAFWTAIALGLPVAVFGWLHDHTTRFDHTIGQAAARNGVDFYLVKAVVFEESWFVSDIRGTAGESGLMQITMAAAKDCLERKGFPPVSETRLMEPDLNVEIGAWYLRQSLDRFRHAPVPELFALLRYNAGEARAARWLELALAKPAPPGVDPERYYLALVDFPRTRDYVRNILERRRSHNFWF